jgi:hypothetical protein
MMPPAVKLYPPHGEAVQGVMASLSWLLDVDTWSAL